MTARSEANKGDVKLSRGVHHASGNSFEILMVEKLLYVSPPFWISHQAALQNIQHITLAAWRKLDFPIHDGLYLMCWIGEVAEWLLPIGDLIQNAT
jgi:hypothetical protein